MILRDYVLFQFAILMLLKYFICEYILQTAEMTMSKYRYGSLNSLVHIAHHAFGTLVILLVYNVSLIQSIFLTLLEAFLHYHIDYIHIRYGAKSYRDKHYWQWLGAEQFLHQLTVILIMALLVKFNPKLDIFF